MNNRWVDQALPECAQWQRDLVDEELTKREDHIDNLQASLECQYAKVEGVQADLAASRECHMLAAEQNARDYLQIEALKARLANRNEAVATARDSEDSLFDKVEQLKEEVTALKTERKLMIYKAAVSFGHFWNGGWYQEEAGDE